MSPPRTWLLRNPHELPMVITLRADYTVYAEFPAVVGCFGIGVSTDPWKARDMAILNCAKAVVQRMEGAQHGPVTA